MSAPLGGRVVLVTRPRPAGEALAERLRGLGAEVIAAPTIEVDRPGPGGPLDEAVRRAAEGGFHWIVFTSAAGVEAWFERADALGVAPPVASVAAVGEATGEALRARGAPPSLVPPEFTTESLGRVFPHGDGAVLLPRADIATGELEDVLRRKGWDPVRVDAYAVTLAESLPEDARRALEEGRVDAVTFTSPSTVEGFVTVAGVPDGPLAVCIGPVTAEAARDAGLEVAAVAEPHTEDGLVEAVVRAIGRG